MILLSDLLSVAARVPETRDTGKPASGSTMTKREVLTNYEEQLDRWVGGESLHVKYRKIGEECGSRSLMRQGAPR